MGEPPMPREDMLIDVVQLPSELSHDHVHGRTVVVLDVLRATTTMTAALAAGVKEILVQPDLDTVRKTATAFGGLALTCGEKDCVMPPDFMLGNSPGGFVPTHAGRTVFMATTNGTKAIIAARQAARMFAGALVNAGAVARTVVATGSDVTLLCAGSDGRVALEDMLGAGAVLSAIEALGAPVLYASDVTLIARDLFTANRADLKSALARTRGGTNIIRSGLQDDIDFCAQLDALDVIGEVDLTNLRVTKLARS
jgi:2-phosphosulfolactate phosphatase